MTGDPPTEISERELEILELVATGATNQQIAQQLRISVNTVKGHLRNINTKIGVNSRTEATLYAVRRGWVKVHDDAGALPVSPEASAAPESVPTAEESLAPASGMNPAEPARTAAPAASSAWSRGRIAFMLVAIVGGSLVLLLAVLGLSSRLGAPAGATDTAPAEDGNVRVPPLDEADAAHWRQLAALPMGLAGFALVSDNDDGTTYLYVIGGETDDTVRNSVLRYDEDNDIWVERSSKPTAVSDVQAVMVGSRLYVPGGRNADGEMIDRFEVYDLRTDSWESLQPLPMPRSGYALAAVEGKIYLFGGWDGSSYQDDVWIYDPDEDSWSEGTAMPTARAFAGAVSLNGQISVVGGENRSGLLQVHEQYAPVDDQSGTTPWSNRARLPEGRSHIAVAQSGGLIFLVGGEGADSPLLVYHDRTDSWDAQDVPLDELRGLRTAVMNNHLYIVGGRTAGGISDQVYQYQVFYTVVLPFAP
jgi:DNA-binding CsgD family transcriptional regulator/N-acetylneuraminic acid mutarotase